MEANLPEFLPPSDPFMETTRQMPKVRHVSGTRRNTIPPLGLTGSGNDHAQLFAGNGKSGRQVAGPFTIQFQGCSSVAGQFKARCAEPLYDVSGQSSPHKQTRQAAQQGQPVGPWQNANIQ